MVRLKTFNVTKAAGPIEGIPSYNGSIQEIMVEAVENSFETNPNNHPSFMERNFYDRLTAVAKKSTGTDRAETEEKEKESVSGSESVDADEEDDTVQSNNLGITMGHSSLRYYPNPSSLADENDQGDASSVTKISVPNGYEGQSNHIEITPLPFVPGGRVEFHLGHISLNFVKEDTTINESGGGLAAFINSFMMEVQAVVRTNVIALGGNALVSFKLNRSIIQERLKNHGYGLISITGDVVSIAQDAESKNLAGTRSPGNIAEAELFIR